MFVKGTTTERHDQHAEIIEVCAKLTTTNMSHQQWRDWVSPDIDYIKVCPGLPITPDAPAH
jgi:hypothetical protein